jgi:guanylate kinase
LIFLAASSEEELITRLETRNTESPDQLKIRIATSRQEMRRLQEFDYIVVNRQNHLHEAVAQVVAIIEAEHCRVRPRHVRL